MRHQRRTQPEAGTLKSGPVTTKGPKNEPYPDFQKRVAADYKRVKEKCDALDKFIPRCTLLRANV